MPYANFDHGLHFGTLQIYLIGIKPKKNITLESLL